MWLIAGILSMLAFISRKEKKFVHEDNYIEHETFMFKFIYKINGYIKYK
jgi:hypothetical protein